MASHIYCYGGAAATLSRGDWRWNGFFEVEHFVDIIFASTECHSYISKGYFYPRKVMSRHHAPHCQVVENQQHM